MLRARFDVVYRAGVASGRIRDGEDVVLRAWP